MKAVHHPTIERFFFKRSLYRHRAGWYSFSPPSRLPGSGIDERSRKHRSGRCLAPALSREALRNQKWRRPASRDTGLVVYTR